MMGIAKRHAQGTHQPIGQIGGGREPRGGSRFKALLIGSHIANHAAHRRQCQHQIICGIKDLLFVFLHVLGIGQRQAFHHHHQSHIGAEDPANLCPDQFRGIGVLLLRHNRRAR